MFHLPDFIIKFTVSMRKSSNIVFILLILQSCHFSVLSIKQKPEPEQYNYELNLVDESRIRLDSMTTPEVETFNYRIQDKGDLSFYNPFSKKIYFYNFQTKNFIDAISLNQLPIQKPIDISGHYIHNSDSIFLFDSWKSRVYLISKKGDLVDSFSVNNIKKDKFILPTIAFNNAMQAHFYKGKLYITGLTIGEFEYETSSNRPILIVVDLKNGSTSYIGSYPEIYRRENANWGGVNYRSVFTMFDDENAFLSFPASHNIIRLNLNSGKTDEYYSGSRFFDTIPSINKAKKEWNNKNLHNKHHFENGSYSSVIYDPYRNFVYRVGELPLNEFVEGIRGKMVKQFSIIILDSNLNKVGETLIPQLSHSRLGFFVTPSGLHMRKYENTEEELVLSTFLPIKK